MTESNLTTGTNNPSNPEKDQVLTSYLKILLKLGFGFYFPDNTGMIAPSPKMQSFELMDTFRQRLSPSSSDDSLRFVLMLRTDRPNSSAVKQMAAKLNYADTAVRLLALDRQCRQRIDALQKLQDLSQEVQQSIETIQTIASPQQLERLFPDWQEFFQSQLCAKTDAEKLTQGVLLAVQEFRPSIQERLHDLLLDCYQHKPDWKVSNDPVAEFLSVTEEDPDIINRAIIMASNSNCQYDGIDIGLESLNFSFVDDLLKTHTDIEQSNVLWSVLRKTFEEMEAMSCRKEA